MRAPLPRDPIALVWVATARRLGLEVQRSPSVFASTDGAGTLLLGTRPSLDPDDHTAQMVLHEICHWIVNGEGAIGEIDWGFPPMEGLDWREYPTLRLQLWLARSHALCPLMAPTTMARAYWDRLVDPLAPLDSSPEEARIVARTIEAIARSTTAPWAEPLQDALTATAAIVERVRRTTGAGPMQPR